ncbi:MAG TPA: helix-turn-helix domain-containing protein [Bryobacteraceae bacterium]|nr:helix-turn-helix domain-containing protein [Bryobacteraceae bacterium]
MRTSDRLTAAVLGSLDEPSATGDLARRAWWSRTQFYRLFRSAVDETPGAMRRRLLLERAAWQLGRTERSVTDIALDAQYGSLEAFTRAFRRAFGISPSLYRRLGPTHFHLPARSGIHFWSGCHSAQGESPMDLFDRFAGHDSWHTRRLLEQAATLTDQQLDRPLKGSIPLFPFCEPDHNLRELLDRLVRTKEVWTLALTGRPFPAGDDQIEGADRSPAGLLARYDKADAEFNAVLRKVRDRGAWDDTFVDALCEPAETFTFGGMFAHVITFNIYRRLTAVALLRNAGVKDVGMGCPTEYESTVQPWRKEEAVSRT